MLKASTVAIVIGLVVVGFLVRSIGSTVSETRSIAAVVAQAGR